ncbi:hypothetical protein AB0A77_25745 [Streptomyces varsoviensis]|uniref:hypothetical protein n=1 Tax=Streptomyces varsoviensis TaxID=67373 RepID=UPI00340155FE
MRAGRSGSAPLRPVTVAARTVVGPRGRPGGRLVELDGRVPLNLDDGVPYEAQRAQRARRAQRGPNR